MRKFFSLLLLFVSSTSLANGKILGTPGVSQVEGSGGGGLVPWAQLAGYATEDEITLSGFCTQANVTNFSLKSCGIQGNVFDKLELSIAEQTFDVNPLSLTLKQEIYGAKVRLYGDVVYSNWPQFTVGLQHKKLKTAAVAYSLGADKDSGTDLYISASKLHLGLFAGYNVLWNATIRYTKSNEMGLLGFSNTINGKKLQAELSGAILLNKHFALGAEYRQKPDNLALREKDWKDIFIAWFPNKRLSITAAYVDLGTIAAIENQTGWYFSINGYY